MNEEAGASDSPHTTAPDEGSQEGESDGGMDVSRMGYENLNRFAVTELIDLGVCHHPLVEKVTFGLLREFSALVHQAKIPKSGKEDLKSGQALLPINDLPLSNVRRWRLLLIQHHRSEKVHWRIPAVPPGIPRTSARCPPSHCCS